MERLTISGFLLRLAFALVLVFATYNPSGHSYLHWLMGGLPKITALVSVGWLDPANRGVLGWILLVMLAIVLAIGMSWSLVQRRLTGQADVDDVDRG